MTGIVVEIPVAIGCLDRPLTFSFFSDFFSLSLTVVEALEMVVAIELVGDASKSSELELVVEPSGVNSFNVEGKGLEVAFAIE